MSRITWDATGTRKAETGTKNGVVYPYHQGIDAASSGYLHGYGWNGLTGVSDSPDGAEETALYADDTKYLSLRSAENYNFTIKAYTYPDEFEECDGTASLGGVPGVKVRQQKRKLFGFTYITTIANDIDGNDFAEKLHIIYGATCSPSSKDYKSINDSPEGIEFSWECKTTPIDMPGTLKKSSCIEIDTSKFDTPPTGYTKEQLVANYAKLKDALYGTSETDPYLPLPSEVLSIMSAAVQSQSEPASG